ncbi:MAG: DUF2809 domain-containing protein [Bacteroidota bacterium]
MFTFNKNYFVVTLLLFITEVLIALYVHDNFVRPYLGDVIVVILIYCFVKSFVKLPVVTVAIAVLLFAFTIEFLQYINIVEKLGVSDSKLARTIIGTSFAWEDVVCYVAGIIIVMAVEKKNSEKEIKNQ